LRCKVQIAEKTTMTQHLAAGNRLTTTSDRPADFHVNCAAAEAGSLNVAAGAVSITVAQRVRLEGKEQFWESIQLRCQKEEDGSLTVQIRLWDPKLEDALQIAFLRSRPDDCAEDQAVLEYDLSQKLLP
jgi:hypothetical protein